jgi:hypothetical protein
MSELIRKYLQDNNLSDILSELVLLERDDLIEWFLIQVEEDKGYFE